MLDGSLEVESLDQGSLLEGLSVADTLDFDPLRVGSNTELRMFSDTLLDDVGDMLEGRSELLELVVAERDVVCDIALVARAVEGLLELGFGFFVLLLLVEDASLSDNSFG